MRTWLPILVSLIVAVASVTATRAQQGSAADIRRLTNQGTVGIISGGVNGTYIRIASDLAAVLNERGELRVLPILGQGSVQNITDILYLRGIDIGIVQSDVLEFVRREEIHPTIGARIRYITKLYNEEFHVLGGQGVQTLADLAGRKVNFDVPGSGTYMTAQTIFDTLDIPVEPVSYDQALAYEKLRSGEIAGMVYVAGKPTTLFEGVEPEAGIAFVSVPATPELLDIYLPANLEHADYPRLIPEGETVETVAVGAVMAVYNWNRNSERYRKVANFVQTFFDNFDDFLSAPRHPKWQEVNLSAVVPGWTRFPAAQEWLDAQPPPLSAEEQRLHDHFEAFMRFMRDQVAAGNLDNLTPVGRKDLFLEFLEWEQERAN